MFEFNPDGSIKLPDSLAKTRQENEQKMKIQHCIELKRELVSSVSPKKCVLHIKISEAFNDNSFVENIHRYFREQASVPSKINKINYREFEIEIGTDFKRCSDCNSLVGRYREFLDGNFIEHKGSCSYESRGFSYEDHFE